jgi:hypothetical protein
MFRHRSTALSCDLADDRRVMGYLQVDPGPHASDPFCIGAALSDGSSRPIDVAAAGWSTTVYDDAMKEAVYQRVKSMPFERGTGSPRPALCGDRPASFQSLSNLGRI